jgi:hypothetical protein
VRLLDSGKYSKSHRSGCKRFWLQAREPLRLRSGQVFTPPEKTVPAFNDEVIREK